MGALLKYFPSVRSLRFILQNKVRRPIIPLKTSLLGNSSKGAFQVRRANQVRDRLYSNCAFEGGHRLKRCIPRMQTLYCSFVNINQLHHPATFIKIFIFHGGTFSSFILIRSKVIFSEAELIFLNIH